MGFVVADALGVPVEFKKRDTYWCLIHSTSYEECVLLAVNLGDDTDTVAAIAGGLAGLMYGINDANGIPERWIAQIPKKEWIVELCQRFAALNL